MLSKLTEAIFGTFVSEVVSGSFDVTKDKIKEAVKNRKNKHQNIESQIYNITVDVLNEFTYKKYKNQDIIYETAEKMLKGFQKRKVNNMEILKLSLYNVVKQIDNDKCEKFIEILSYKLNQEEYKKLYHRISLQKEEKKLRYIRKGIKVKHLFNKSSVNAFFTIIGYISSVITIFVAIHGLFFPLDDSIAMDNYQRGKNYFEELNFESAEKCFESAYKINCDLDHLIYYYAYTEFMLENFDKSYKILVENKDSLDEDEMVVLAMYEYKNKNYEKSKQYMETIQEPEKLDIFAFYEYIDYTTKLGFLNDYGEGLNVVCKNIVYLEAKLNVVSVLPTVTNKGFYNVNEFKIDQEKLLEILHRIEDYTIFEKSKCIRAESYMYFLLFYYSIQYDNIEVPTRYFANIAQSLDYANNYDITKPLMSIMYLYVAKLKFHTGMPEEIKEAFKIVTKKYDNWKKMEKEQGLKIQEEDRKLLDIFVKISEEMENDTFDLMNYNFVPELDSEYNENNLLKKWARTFEYMVNYKGR